MDPGRALISSIEIIKMLYETAELYKKLERINGNLLNEMSLIVSLKDQITSCRRMQNNQVIDNYLLDINKRLEKFKKIVENIHNQNFLKKIIYTKKIEKIGKEISKAMKKMKMLLDLKKDLQQSSRLDVANILTDIKAREFWEVNFGSEHTFVQTNLFFSAIRMNTQLLSNEIDFLKKVINDDNDKYISAFEFQEWLDFFGDFTVAMRRTIDSLFDPNTYEIVEWYQKNISKSIVKSILNEQPLILRKHSNQKGVFIINFKYNNEIHELFIKNINNEFVIEIMPNMNPIESKIYEELDIKKAANLKTIINSLEYRIIPLNQKKDLVDWDQERINHLDKPIPTPIENKELNLFDLPGISHLKNGIGTIIDTGVDIGKGVIDTGVGIGKGFFNFLTPR